MAEEDGGAGGGDASATLPSREAGGGGRAAAAAVLGGGQGDPYTCPPTQQPTHVPPPITPLSGGEFLLQLLRQSHPQPHTSSFPPILPPPGYAASDSPVSSSLPLLGGSGGGDHGDPAVAALGPCHPYPHSAPTRISDNTDSNNYNFPDAGRLPTAPAPPRQPPPGFPQASWAAPPPGFSPLQPTTGFYHQMPLPSGGHHGHHHPFLQAETQLSGSFPGNPSHAQHPQQQQHWNGFPAGNTLQFGSITSHGLFLPNNNNHSSPPNQAHGYLPNSPPAQNPFTGHVPELEVGLVRRSTAGFSSSPESRWIHHPKAQPGSCEVSDLHHGRRRGAHPRQQQQRAPFSGPVSVDSGRPLVPPHKPKDLGHRASVGNERRDGKCIMDFRPEFQYREKPFPSYAKDEMLQRNSHLALTPDVKEYQMDLKNENIDERHGLDAQGAEKMSGKVADGLAHSMQTSKEQNSSAEQLVDTLILAEDDTDNKVARPANGSRGKDYRSDFSRGHRVLSQRMRIRRRQLLCRSDIVRLTPYFLSIYESLIPTVEEKAKQKQLLLLLEKLVKKEWPNAQVYLYGSCANSFGVSNSDIDVCLAIDDDGISKSEILLKVADILQSDNLQNVQALTRARVPIVKLMDPTTEISCDICINNLLAVVNTKLLRDYAQIDDRLQQLAFIVKHWAKSRGVNETYQGTLSSYAYVLMCIYFLQQCKPAILPCLQEMEATYVVTVDDIECAFFDQVEKLRGFGSWNKESIAELLWAFFSYWAYHHDYANDVISVRTGSIISKQAKDWTRRIGNDRHLICIEDPFETSHDLGRVVDKYTIKILREEFERAAEIMQYDPNPSVKLFEPYVRGSDLD